MAGSNPAGRIEVPAKRGFLREPRTPRSSKRRLQRISNPKSAVFLSDRRRPLDPNRYVSAERRKSLLSKVLSELGSGLAGEASTLARVPPVVLDQRAPDHLQQLVVEA